LRWRDLSFSQRQVFISQTNFWKPSNEKKANAITSQMAILIQSARVIRSHIAISYE
jgi:hypothetical protein